MIRASQAYTNIGSIQTILNGERNVGCIIINQGEESEVYTILKNNNISFLKIEKNRFNFNVIFRESHKQDALDLAAIADKYLYRRFRN